MAHYRAGWNDGKLINGADFWKSINGNCFDYAVLEWCKLFADKKDNHFWKNIVANKDQFENNLQGAIGEISNPEEFPNYIKIMRRYRDKFIAHLDDDLTAHLPSLDIGLQAVQTYYQYIIDIEASKEALTALPSNIKEYYERSYAEARHAYEASQT